MMVYSMTLKNFLPDITFNKYGDYALDWINSSKYWSLFYGSVGTHKHMNFTNLSGHISTHLVAFSLNILIFYW